MFNRDTFTMFRFSNCPVLYGWPFKLQIFQKINQRQFINEQHQLPILHNSIFMEFPYPFASIFSHWEKNSKIIKNLNIGYSLLKSFKTSKQLLSSAGLSDEEKIDNMNVNFAWTFYLKGSILQATDFTVHKPHLPYACACE